MFKVFRYPALIMVVLFFTLSHMAQGQDLLRNYNLREINVDQLSDAEILKYMQQLKTLNITQDQAEQIAVSRGMPLSEIQKLKQRVSVINSKGGIQNIQSQLNAPTQGESLNQLDTTNLRIDTSKAFKPLIDPRIFGAELFNNASLTFEPNLSIATPVNYELGPGDALNISVYGTQEFSQLVTVSAEGNVNIPQVGQIKLGGLTVEAATARIKNIMMNGVYPTLKSGSSKVSVTLGNIRSIRITIIGANKPGNFTVPSLTTAFNALFLSGGPSAFGSFREIELIRDNKVYKKIDLYRFLVNGDQSDNVTLKDNDVIRIPTYKTRADIEGYVRRPGFFELLSGESLKDLLQFSSGFSDSAYRASVKITQFTDKELKVRDVSSDSFSLYHPNDGDYINVAKVLSRYTNRVVISGAVFRPGAYELLPGMTAAELINKSDGLTEDAYTGRAQIFRLKDDLSKEVLSFNAGTSSGPNTIFLRRNDSVVVHSIFDLRDEYYISVQGEVRNPGIYHYSDSLHLKDIFLLAGGLTDAAYPQKIEIARIIKRDTLTSQDVRSTQIIEINGITDLSSPAKDINLQPSDIITVRRKPGFLEMESVKVSGELQYPGPYVIEKREERVSDLIKRAGGFTPEAHVQGAYIKRYNFDLMNTQLRRQIVANIQEQLNDSTNTAQPDIQREYDQIPLNIEKILSQPGSTEDVVLVARDELYVPKFNPQVRISGSVLFPTQIPFNEKYDLKDYLSSAGGVSNDGKKSKIYVLYPNGKGASTSTFLFFKDYPSVKPGTEIIVPSKGEKGKLSTGEILGLSSALTSLAGVVIAILNLSK